jgi:riboflavin biosynthesis pyrimidine reductase
MGELRNLGAAFVLCEGGPTLNGGLIAAGVVDEVCSTLSPIVVGGDSLRFTAGGDALEPPQAMVLDYLLEDDGVLFFRWIRREA